MAYERDYKVTASLHDAYKVYKKLYKDIKDRRKFLDIAYDINKCLSDMIIRDSLEYRLPERMGFLRIKKKKQKLIIINGRISPKKNIIDWENTWKLWKEMYQDKSWKEIKKMKGKQVLFQTNRHTDGEIMKWYWRKGSGVKNSTVYVFDVVKGGIVENKYTGRLGLAWWIKSDDKTNDYYF